MARFILSTTIEEKDWDELFVINWECFKNSPEIAVLSPGGLDLAHRANNTEGFRRGVFGGPIERTYAKISEVQSQQITSFISARVYRGPKGAADCASGEAPPPVQLPFIQDKGDRAFYEWYWTSIREFSLRSKVLQVPLVMVQVLATDPKWQHQGAASMLVKWILEFTAKEKIGRIALQAGGQASLTEFYESFGFRVVERLSFTDDDHFPGRVGTPVVIMIKDF